MVIDSRVQAVPDVLEVVPDLLAATARVTREKAGFTYLWHGGPLVEVLDEGGAYMESFVVAEWIDGLGEDEEPSAAVVTEAISRYEP